jgi:hypothetical protein
MLLCGFSLAGVSPPRDVSILHRQSLDGKGKLCSSLYQLQGLAEQLPGPLGTRAPGREDLRAQGLP